MVWFASAEERSTARASFGESRAAAAMLTAMLEQESSFRAYAELRHPRFVDSYYRARQRFEAALAAAQASVAEGEKPEAQKLAAQRRLAAAWQRSADKTVADIRVKGRAGLSLRVAVDRERLITRFGAQNAALQRVLDSERDASLATTGRVAAGAILLLSLLFGVGGYILVERRGRIQARRDGQQERYRRAQIEFNETLQVMSDEAEAHELLQRHLKRLMAGSDVAVLNRNNSDNRLVNAAPLPEQSPLHQRLEDAEATSCLAVRLGKTHEQGRGIDPLLTCALCERSGALSLCTPSLVGGKVVGSVLVQSDEELAGRDRQLVADCVAQAAPVLANLRNLAIANTRAATDVLTGLPNKRSALESAKRMLAQAARTETQLSAIFFDLDHFKQINDVYGHGKGDEVLASVGDTVSSMIRASDFAARFGGEEFLILAPHTDRPGAIELAEKLRQALLGLDVALLERTLSASFGVATFPQDASAPEELVRAADRALYLAKSKGRNRVETAAPESDDPVIEHASVR